MPQVPRTVGPSVQLQAAPNVQQNIGGITPDAFGAGVTRTLQQGADVALKLKDQDDADQVFRAETALKTDYLAFERSEMERQGADAKGAGERSAKWWGEAQTKYTENFSNDRQSRLFQRSSVAVQMAGNETLLRHETQQRNKSVAESTIAQSQSAAELAIADPSPDRVALSKQQIISSNKVLGQLRGDTPEIVEQRTKEALTGMHKGIIMRTVDNDPDAAKAYFYTNRKEINGGDQVVIEKALKQGGLVLKGQQAADEIMTKFPDLNEANTYIEQNYSGEEEAAVKREVHQRWAVKDSVTNKARTEAYGQGQLLVTKGQPIPQSLALTMGDGHYAMLMEHREALAHRREIEARERSVKTDFSTYDMLNEMSWKDPQKFAQIDLGRFQDRLSTADLKKFSEDKQRAGTAEGIKGLQTRSQQITTAVDQMALGGQTNAEKRGLFTRNVNDAIEEEQKTQGRPLKREEIQKVIDQQVMEVSVPGFFWDTGKRAFELTPEDKSKTVKVVVPDFDRKQIETALKARGKPVNPANVEALYRQVKGIK
jgi:hypothetical protein